MNDNERIGAFIGLGGALVTLFGSVMPWAVLRAGILTVSKAGTEGDGQVALVFALIGAALCGATFLTDQYPRVGIGIGLCGAAIIAITTLDYVDITAKISGETLVSGGPGGGIFVAFVGGLAVVVGGALVARGLLPGLQSGPSLRPRVVVTTPHPAGTATPTPTPTVPMVQCNRCKAVVPDAEKHLHVCPAAGPTCTACGVTGAVGMAFCARCGGRLA